VRVGEDNKVEALPEFRVRQASFSNVLPGTVKAWHLQRRQEDLWFIPPSHRLLVGLLDVRARSPTYRRSMRFVMGGGAAILAFIPAAVAHGVANPWQQPAAIINFVSSQFDPANPDEVRLPWDRLGADFWHMRHG